MSPAVLIFSTNEALRTAWGWVVEGASMEAITAADPNAGMMHLATIPRIRAVLLDLDLGGIRPAAVLTAIRKQHPDVAVIAVAKALSDVERDALLTAGANGAITQDEAMDALPKILRSVAEKPTVPTQLRAHERKQVAVEVGVAVGQGAYEKGVTRDVSAGGAFIATKTPPPPPPAALRVRLPGADGKPLEVNAEVRRATPGGVAVEFKPENENEKQSLSKMMSQLSADELFDETIDGTPPDLEEPLAEEPETVESEISIGERLLAIGNYTLAQQRFAKALERNPDNERLTFLFVLTGAREAMFNKNWDSAIDCFDQLLAIDPTCEEALEGKKEIERQKKGKGIFSKIFSR